MRKIVISIICIFMFQSGISLTFGALAAQQRVGIAYGDVLEKGWSALMPWYVKKKYKGLSRHIYRRRIVDLKFTRNGFCLIFANGSKRKFHDIALINNVTYDNGGLKYWKIARKHKKKDTLVLKNGDVIHTIIRGYEKDFYIFNDIKPIHSDYIHLIYPNPSIPLRARR